MPDHADDNPSDTTTYELAEQVAGGNPCSDAGAREIAAELLRVRGEVRQAHIRLDDAHLSDAIRIVVGLAVSMGLAP